MAKKKELNEEDCTFPPRLQVVLLMALDRPYRCSFVRSFVRWLARLLIHLASIGLADSKMGAGLRRLV